MTDAVDQVIALWRTERPELSDELWPVGVIGRIQRLNRLLERKLKEFNAEHELETWEFDVLTTLRRSGDESGLTPGALLRAAMVTSGAITNRIDRLEARGLVERVRDGGDRRSVRIRLTTRGRQVVDEVFGLHLRNEARILPELSPREWEDLAAGLRVVLEHFGDTTLD